MSDIEFAKGMIVKPPRDGAPDFVKCTVSIKVNEFQEFLSGKQTEWVNLDFKISKDGKWYAAVNNWKPDASKQKHAEEKADGYASEKKAFVDDDINDIPF